MRRNLSVNHYGYTFVELMVVSAIVMILASGTVPLVKVTATRMREAELRRALRELRTALDKYKDAVDAGIVASTEVKVGSGGYPPDLDALVEGATVANTATSRKLKFLRRIPIDPMTHGTDWGMRSFSDDLDATSWGGDSVFDVYTKQEGVALDGSYYRDW